MTIQEAVSSFPKRAPDSGKSDYGHVLVLAGSCGYTGAAYLASQAALVSGSGLVTLAVGKSIYPIMALKLTEVMVRPFFETKDLSLGIMAERDLLLYSEKCATLVIGPGMSRNKETQNLIRNMVAKANKPIVLDADGINAFAGRSEGLKTTKAPLVLTPHLGEMERLTGIPRTEIQNNRKDVALKFASEYNTVLVLKGHNTVVAAPTGDVYVNGTGNAGMASGGTGDVLAGVIAGFIAQGADAYKASMLGVYFHGVAGDLAAKEKGLLGLTATDLLNKIPEATKVLA